MAEPKSKLVEIKTKPTTASVEDFINAVSDEQKRQDCLVLLKIMKEASKQEPILWSNSIVGFGIKRFKSPATGREVDWLQIGFSPRKANLSLTLGVSLKKHEPNLQKLGKHKTGVGCLYINKLSDIDLNILQIIIQDSLKFSE
jgi:hypothetical protein